jgi:hypothetical protein
MFPHQAFQEIHILVSLSSHGIEVCHFQFFREIALSWGMKKSFRRQVEDISQVRFRRSCYRIDFPGRDELKTGTSDICRALPRLLHWYESAANTGLDYLERSFLPHFELATVHRSLAR